MKGRKKKQQAKPKEKEIKKKETSNNITILEKASMTWE